MPVKPSLARLNRLLSNGYLPAELPPPFTSSYFAKECEFFNGKWKEKDIFSFSSKPEHYSSPRFGHSRRKLSIVNPVNQFLVSSLIATNWFKISKLIRSSDSSEFKAKIIFKGDGRAISGIDFDAVARRKVAILSGYGRYVKTDVARFYPSIYTHSIPWAVLGKQYCKDNMKKPHFKSEFSDKIDAAVRSGQEGQTIGIPIGPDTSRILSELIAVDIENSIKAEIPDWNERAVRYVDDILVGLADSESPAEIISAISSSLYNYELEINSAKTKVCGIGNAHTPEWINYIRTFNLKSGNQDSDIDSFFEQSIYLSGRNPDENVLSYACKRATSFNVKDESLAHLVRWIIYCCRRSPVCIRGTSPFLRDTASRDPKLSDEIKRFVVQQIPAKSSSGHTEELSWLLFLSRECSFDLDEKLFDIITKMNNATVALLCLDIRQNGKIIGDIDDTYWKSFCNLAGLKSEMWMCAYEATLKEWWKSKQSDSYIKSTVMFSDIYSKSVIFYDEKRKMPAAWNNPFKNMRLFQNYIETPDTAFPQAWEAYGF